MEHILKNLTIRCPKALVWSKELSCLLTNFEKVQALSKDKCTSVNSFHLSSNVCHLLITFCNQFGSRSFDTLIVFLKELFEKVSFEKNQQTTKKLKNIPRMQIR